MADLRDNSTSSTEHTKAVHEKRPWEPVRLTYVGHISEIIRGGGGKLTMAGGDPGEGKKPAGGGT